MLRPVAILLVLSVLAGCASTPTPAPTTASTNAYAGLQASPIRGLTPQDIAAIEAGREGPRALVAELNGYPGPGVALELADKIGLNATQRAALTGIRDRAMVDAQATGRDLLQARRTLDQAFRAGTVSTDELETLLGAVALAETELDLVHLEAHVEAHRILTSHQTALYMELRGYGRQDHASHTH